MKQFKKTLLGIIMLLAVFMLVGYNTKRISSLPYEDDFVGKLPKDYLPNNINDSGLTNSMSFDKLLDANLYDEDTAVNYNQIVRNYVIVFKGEVGANCTESKIY